MWTRLTEYHVTCAFTFFPLRIKNRTWHNDMSFREFCLFFILFYFSLMRCVPHWFLPLVSSRFVYLFVFFLSILIVLKVEKKKRRKSDNSRSNTNANCVGGTKWREKAGIPVCSLFGVCVCAVFFVRLRSLPIRCFYSNNRANCRLEIILLNK